jgi:hypothetical protein
MPRSELRISVRGMAQKGDTKSIFAVTVRPSSVEKPRNRSGSRMDLPCKCCKVRSV